MFVALAAMLAMQPDPAMLRRIFEEGYQRAQKKYGEADARTAQAARDLGLFLRQNGDPEGASVPLYDALQIDEKALGANDRRTLEDAANLASVSPPGLAEGLWKWAAASPDVRVSIRSLVTLAEISRAKGDSQAAADFYQQAISKEQVVSGKDSAPVARLLNGLGPLLEPPQAIPLLERALAINRKVLGARHPETATTEANLAGVLLNVKRTAESIRLATDAISVFEETLGREHPRTALSLTILGFGLRAKGDRTGAERCYRRALAVDERAYGPDHPQTLEDRRTLEEFLGEK